MNNNTKDSECRHEIRKVTLKNMDTKQNGNETIISVRLVCECGQEFHYGGTWEPMRRLFR